MSLEVVLTNRAVTDIDAALTFYSERSESVSLRWVAAVERAIELLEEHPERYATARESQRLGVDLRQINFGAGRRPTHRMLYAIRPAKVVIFTVRHLAQRDIEFEDLQ